MRGTSFLFAFEMVNGVKKNRYQPYHRGYSQPYHRGYSQPYHRVTVNPIIEL